MGLSASAPWLKYYGNTPASLEYPHKTMYEMVAAAAKKYPDHTAYIFMGKKTSYTEFMKRIHAAAKGLYKMGIRKGDKVTICMANTPQALDCFYALNRIGAIPNMIHPLSAAQEIAFYLNFSQSKAILTLDQFYEKVVSIQPQLKNPTTILIAKVADELPIPLNVLYPMTKAARAVKKLPKTGYTLWYDMVRAGKNEKLPPISNRYDECGAILYSGGTTGTTKGIMLSNLNFNALALQTSAASGFTLEEISNMKMLSVMPVFHGFGLGIGIHLPLINGATCILIPQFNVKTYAETLVKQKPNLIPGVPTLFEALLRADNLEGADLSFLKGIFYRCAVYDIYNCCVDAFSCFIMIRCFCELRNMRRVFYNCGEDWLSTKEFIWLVINLRFTCRQITGDCTCFRKDCIIEVCAGTKCACKEVFCKFYIFAVRCNVPGRSTVVCIVCSCINIVYFRHCCDLPQTLLIFCRHQSSCDPVTIYNTCCLTACDCCDIFIPVVYKFNNIIFNEVYIKVDAFFCNIISNDVSFAVFIYEVSSTGLHHHHQSIATCSFTCKKIFSGFFMNIFTDFHELGPCDICQIIQCISCFVKDICTVACDNSTIIKRNTIMCVIYHGVGLFQFSEIIPVDSHIRQVGKGIRITF